MTTSADVIIEDIVRCHEQILELCRDVPEELLSAPTLPNGWSAKDVVAHIAAWDWRCAALLGESYYTSTPLKAHPAVDALNLEIYNERRHWPWAEVEQDFQAGHRALVEAIRALPPERLADEVIQESIAEETCEHYGQHIPDLERWRQQVEARRVPGRK